MLSKLADILGQFLVLKLGKELADQGHRLTGSLIESLEYKVREKTAGVVVEFFVNEYGVYLNNGIPASRIPYTPGGKRRGGTSQYIQALIRYVERRMGLRGKEATGVAFAIARAHKREGMPTRGSFRYSKNGRRTGWVDAVLAEQAGVIDEMITEFMGRELNTLISNFIKQAA